MTPQIVPEKKKKRFPRRRWRILLPVIVVLVLAGTVMLALKPWLEQYAFYQEMVKLSEAREKKIYSPDGTRYAVPSINNYESSGVGWLMDTRASRAYTLTYPDTLFSGAIWTADSRYVLLASSNHYGMGRLIGFDMEHGQFIDLPHTCAMFSMSPCDYEYVLAIAPASPMFINRSGTLFNLQNGTHIDLLTENGVGRTMIQAFWSPSEKGLFVLAIRYTSTNPGSNPQIYALSLAGYMMEADGTNPVEAFVIEDDTAKPWIKSQIIDSTHPQLCLWKRDDSGAECIIHNQVYIQKKD